MISSVHLLDIQIQYVWLCSVCCCVFGANNRVQRHTTLWHIVDYRRELRADKSKRYLLLENTTCVVSQWNVWPRYANRICEAARYVKKRSKAYIYQIILLLILHSGTEITLHQYNVARLRIYTSRHPHNSLHGTMKLQGCRLSSWRLDSVPIKGNNHFLDLFHADLVSSDKQKLTVWNQTFFRSSPSRMFFFSFGVALCCCQDSSVFTYSSA